MKEKMKEPRIWMCVVFYMLSALPWLTVKTTTDGAGVSASASANVSGYTTLFGSIFGIILFLIPILLAVLEFLPQIELPKRLVYAAGGVLGVILTILSGLFGSSAVKAGGNVSAEAAGVEVSAKSSASFAIGIWLAIVLFLAMVVYTIVKDFAINQAVLKEQGIKGAFSSVAESVTKDASQSMKQMNQAGGISNFASNKCPQCGAMVLKGKKFCNKCGAKLLETEDKDRQTPKILNAAKKTEVQKAENTMQTVRQYIASLGQITCSSCGERVDATKKFCPNCGDTIVVKAFPDKCENCGGAILEGKKFCPECGVQVRERVLKTNCVKCNAELIYRKGFCVECGEKVES